LVAVPEPQAGGGEEKLAGFPVASESAMQYESREEIPAVLTVNHAKETVPVFATTTLSTAALEPWERSTFEIVTEGPPADAAYPPIAE
jgi:hypothetical protein